MKDINKLTAALFIGLVLAVALIVLQQHTLQKYRNDCNTLISLLEAADTTVITKTDTITLTNTVTKYYPKYISQPASKTDTIYLTDTIYASLPIVERAWEDTLTTTDNDTLKYQIAVQSPEYKNFPNLKYVYIESISKTPVTNTTTIIEKPQKPQTRWNLTIGGGVGYGVINKKPDVFIGITAGYKIK